MCKTTTSIIDEYDEIMNSKVEVFNALKDMAENDGKEMKASSLIISIEKAKRSSDAMKIELANLIISMTTDAAYETATRIIQQFGDE